MDPGTIAILGVVGAQVTALVTWGLSRLRDRGELKSKILYQRYERQLQLFEEFERRSTDAYRGSIEREDREKRKIETLTFRIRVWQAFGDETLGNEAMGTIFLYEDAHVRRMGKGGVAIPDGPGAAELSRQAGEQFHGCVAKMLRELQRFEKKMGIPSAQVTPKTAKLLAKLDAEDAARAAQLESKGDRQELQAGGGAPLGLPPKK